MILVTGSTGFIGNALIRRLAELGEKNLRACSRKSDAIFPVGINSVLIESVSNTTDWQDALKQVDVVIHTVARVHRLNDKSKNPLSAFRETNVDATINLAKQAVSAGVKRFVFISSVKVNGESTSDKAFTAFDIPAPLDPYGISKHEAEQGLLAFAKDTGLEVVIIRPPLVYGPNVRANFLRLMRLMKWGVPLPFSAIDNRRSMVAIDNLVDLLITCTVHPSAAGQIFMVSDECDVSTPGLLHMIADSMGKKSILFPVPASILAGTAAFVGKSGEANRLLNSLQVDIAHTKSTLGWQPVVNLQESIRTTVEHFLKFQ
ncbi:MAG: SDR family oxidoreductase [Methylococcaceae bacterium]|nr:SDR family oxidoreductase [Methylococcaceae bacterium]